jgi:hypothetical protein
VEIFLAGTRPASNGVSTTITPADLQEIADTYNPKIFRAPAIVSENLGHDIGNYTDTTVSKSKELCHGIPAKLRRVGDRLYAGFESLSPQLANWIRKKQLHSVSSSFYLPNSPNNPYEGKWSLRHIAFLGATPPACKGLAPLPEPPPEWGEGKGKFDPYVVSFEDSFEGVISFEMYMNNSPWAIAADLFQRYREYLIESEDLETADRVLPAEQIAALRDMAASDALKSQQISDLQMQVAQLQMSGDKEEWEESDESTDYEEMNYKALWKESGMTPAEVAEASGLSEEEVTEVCAKGKIPTSKQRKALDKVFGGDVTEMSEELERRAADLVAREEAIANRERALEYNEVSSFVETLVQSGKVKAAKRDDITTLLLNTPNGAEVEFSQATGKKTPRQVLMAEFSDRPSWNFGGTIVKDESDPVNPSFSEEVRALPGASTETVQQHQAIVGWCKKNGKDPSKSADYSEAMMALRIYY